MEPDNQPWPWKKVVSPNPLAIPDLPLIAKLHNIGFHRFRKRWTKRLFKKPARALFDFCYHVLKLGGQGILEFHHEGSVKELTFDAHKLHFSSIYSHPRELIFEPQVMGLLELLMRDDDVFFDIGANWGMETLHAALLPNWTGEIHAFEPVPGTYEDLTSLVSQAGLQKRITCHNIALSDTAGKTFMKLADGIQSGTATITGPDGGGSGFEVRTDKLDDLALSPPTFLKLDVEGHEATVFHGAKEIMAKNRPFVIFESWHTPNDFQNSKDAFDVLENYGYVFFRPAWGHEGPHGVSVWPHTQPPSHTDNRMLSLIPMSADIRPFMSEHIDVFACHASRLGDLKERLQQNS